jgi:hypothetical protein
MEMKMKKKLLTGLFLLLASLCFSEESMKLVMDNITIESPIGWLAQYTKSPNVFFIYSPLEVNDTFQENCNLTVEELYIDMTIEEYFQATLDQLKDFYTNFNLEEKLENYCIYSGILNNVKLRQMQYYYKKDNAVYVLTFTSTPIEFDSYRSIFKEIAASFSID